MIESIIKDTDLDPCAEKMMEKLGASGLFDLSRVHTFFKFSFGFVHSLAGSCLALRRKCV